MPQNPPECGNIGPDSRRTLDQINNTTLQRKSNILKQSPQGKSSADATGGDEERIDKDNYLIVRKFVRALSTCSKYRKWTAPDLSSPQSIIRFTTGKGKDCKVFPIHTNVLQNASPFFRDLLLEQCRKGRSSTINLSDVDPEIFGAVVHYIHTGLIQGEFTLPWLCYLWMVAETLVLPGLQNRAMNVIFLCLSEDAMNRDLHGFFKLVYGSKREYPLLKDAIVVYWALFAISKLWNKYERYFTSEFKAAVEARRIRTPSLEALNWFDFYVDENIAAPNSDSG